MSIPSSEVTFFRLSLGTFIRRISGSNLGSPMVGQYLTGCPNLPQRVQANVLAADVAGAGRFCIDPSAFGTGIAAGTIEGMRGAVLFRVL